MKKSRVALVRGDDRYANVLRALESIEDDIHLAGKRRITIKLNFVSIRRPLSATHPDAVRAVLDYLKARGVDDVTLVEGPSVGAFREGLRAYGYQELIARYRPKVVDLNQDESLEVALYDRDLRPLPLRVARTMMESDYRISVGPPKTHDTVNVTLSLKNIAVGSLVGPNKGRFHQGYQAVNLSLYKLALRIAPHLSVLDGFQAMEGAGPVGGDAVDWRIAIASADFLAADSLACQLMGFPLEDIGYLYYCHLKGLGRGTLEGMEPVGNATFEQVRREFKPHRTHASQLAWKIPDIERYL